MGITPNLSIIAAVASNGVIGINNQLPWHLPEDMQHFRRLTTGHTVIMGRKTWESLPPRFRPLPGRRNIVLSAQTHYTAAGAEVVNSLSAALALLTSEPAFLIGGASLYKEGLAVANQLILTEIELTPAGDAWFPPINRAEWRQTSRQEGVSAEGVRFAFVSLERNPTA